MFLLYILANLRTFNSSLDLLTKETPIITQVNNKLQMVVTHSPVIFTNEA